MAYLWLTSENANLPGCRVNKGKKKGRSVMPRPKENALALVTPLYYMRPYSNLTLLD
jgi:hypothetical protein